MVVDMTARDPLLNETLRVPESEQVISSVPESYRLKKICNRPPEYILQGAYKGYNEQGMIEYQWRDLPTVTED